MLKRHYIYMITIFTLTACITVDKEESENSADNNFKADTLVTNEIELDSDSIKDDKTFGEPIDIFELKRLSFLTVTSGVLPHSESKTFCKSY
ncbi:MAG: hypothetical protein RQ756_01060, partial [Flavobacteriaceae bacterium]|nr:hypothetical protein [Flavobacteriaceae bacterium]